jgi:hypothetical protein
MTAELCYRKYRFPTEKAALEFASHAFTAFPLRAYACPNLETDGTAHWHITKSPGEGTWVQPDLSARPHRLKKFGKRRHV